METKANYTLIGTFVMLFMTGIFCFVLWFSRHDFHEDKHVYLINFTGSVTGLRVGETARFHGIPIGTIKKIAPAKDDPQIIQVKVSIDHHDLIREDSIATIEPQGLTGFTYILIEGGSGESPYLKCKDGERFPVIKSKPSRMEEFFKSAPHIIANLGKLSERLNRVIDDKALHDVTAIISNIASITKDLGSGSDSLQHVFKLTKQSLQSFQIALDKINQQVDPLSVELSASLNGFKTATAGIQQTAAHINYLLDNNRENINEFMASGAGNFNSFINDTRMLIFNINRLLTDLDRSPSQFLTKSSQQGYRP